MPLSDIRREMFKWRSLVWGILDPSAAALGDILIANGAGSAAWGGPPIPAGTIMLFQQTAAPTGWTKITTQNDKALRVVSGTVGTGGSVAFSTVFGRTATDNHTLTLAQMPQHNHSYNTANYTSPTGNSSPNSTPGQVISGTTGNAGSSAAHSHNIDLQVQYVDIILASKN